MNTIGIIIEYNPFHNGHNYHIKQAKVKSDAEFVVGIMSGNYVQRGEPAIINKWDRTKIALNHGVDMVIELPTIYSTQSAEGFAKGSISTLASSGIIDGIIFGSEAGVISPLKKVAQEILEIERTPKLITNKLKEGISYSKTLQKLTANNNFLSGSNNILGIEYIKQNIKLGSPLKVETIKRKNSTYNEATPNNDFFTSATSLRSMIKNQSKELSNYIPPKALSTLKYTQKKQQFIEINSFTDYLFPLLIKDGYKLIPKTQGYEKGLENRIMQALFDGKPKDIETLVSQVNSKRYSRSRINRLLLHFMLGVEKETVIKANIETPYLKILGCSEKGLKLLHKLKKKSAVPYSLNYKNLLDSLPKKGLGYQLLASENIYSNLYIQQSFIHKKYNLEFRHKPIIVK
ncbi:nucleotidyltransferase family protein [Proteinivorax tanatarense]|uniref:tRNA(Met) cytidine acetate ligase n=1 Tax=Proteinivorax tanatarense TaxID=1260629 RepID=A0AAU7VQD3_9FIRM